MHRIDKGYNKGFTIFEAIVVVIIIAMGTSFAIPRFHDYLRRMRNQEAEQVLIALYGAQLDYRRKNPTFYAEADLNLINANLNVTLPIMKHFELQAALGQGGGGPCPPPALGFAVSKDTPTYALYITPEGNLVCASADGGGCNSPFCRRMGY